MTTPRVHVSRLFEPLNCVSASIPCLHHLPSEAVTSVNWSNTGLLLRWPVAGGLLSRSAAQPAGGRASRAAVPASLCAASRGSSVSELARSAGAAHRPSGWIPVLGTRLLCRRTPFPICTPPRPPALSTSAVASSRALLFFLPFSRHRSVQVPQGRSLVRSGSVTPGAPHLVVRAL